MASFQCTKCEKTYKIRCNLTRHQRVHNETAFACEFCEKRFYQKGHLEQHRVAHTFVKAHACDVDGCKKKFTAKGSLKMHKLWVHEKVPGKYRCEQCDRACATPDHLDRHRRIHTRERPYACTECTMKFIQKVDLQGHFRRKHTDERPFACDKCAKRFCTKHEAQLHGVVHTFSKPFICDVGGCEQKFARAGSVLEHTRSVHEKVPMEYRCEQCDRVCATSYDLDKHRRIHTGKRPYACTDCEMKFIKKGHLQEHYRRKHTDERPFTCDKCDQRFCSKRSAQVHGVVHTFSKPYICDVDGCEKRFTMKGSMSRHKLFVHEKVRKYRCDHCDKSFGSSTDLKKHNRLHTGERPYACTECAMKFKEKKNVQAHYRRKHTLERPYACDVLDCEMKFAGIQEAIAHKRYVHEKVPTKHKCELCERTFSESCNLRRHQRTHTGERPFACTLCAKTFGQKVNLHYHLGAKHAEEHALTYKHCQNTLATVQA